MIPLELWYSLERTEGDIASTHEELDATLDRFAAISDSQWAALAEVTQHADKFASMWYVGFHADMSALMYPSRPDRVYTRGHGLPDGEPFSTCNAALTTSSRRTRRYRPR